MMADSILHTTVRAVRRHLIWCLLAVYALATIWPQPGNALRGLELGRMPFSGGMINPTHLLLATLLFSVGLSIGPDAIIRLGRTWKSVLVAFGGTWLIPIGILSLFCALPLKDLDQPVVDAFLLGAALTIAMPPANSASVWTDLTGGEASRTVSLIVLGTVACPVVTPLVLRVFAPATDAGLIEAVSLIGSLEVLIAFVVLPSSLGVCTRYLQETWSSAGHEPSVWHRLVSLSALLLLNYSNGAAALPQLWGSDSYKMLALPLLSVLLCAFVFLATLAVSQFRRRSWIDRVPFIYSTGMKNTGAALVLTISVFPERPEIALVPVFYTIAQHIAAALIDRRTIVQPAALKIDAAQRNTSPTDSPPLVEMKCWRA